MADETTTKTKTTGKLALDNLPDWFKIILLVVSCFGAAGGGSQILGPNYKPEMDKMQLKLESIERNTSSGMSDLRDRITRLEVKVERLDK